MSQYKSDRELAHEKWMETKPPPLARDERIRRNGNMIVSLKPDENEPYIPTAEELKGESWAYCYGNPVVIGPPKDDERSDTE